MIKKQSVIISCIVTVLGAAAVAVSLLRTGADMTEVALLRVLLTLGIALILWGAVSLIFCKAVGAGCHAKTGAEALGMMLALGAGIYCGLSLITCLQTGGIAKHSVRFPISLAAILVCVAVLIIAVTSYIRDRKKNPGAAGIALDLVRAAGFAVPALYAVSLADIVLVNLIH